MSNNINHEIKTIVAELQSMSPRTQLEIVRLCKRVAELTPDYIEAVAEEITDEQYAAFTAALNQAKTELQNNINNEVNNRKNLIDTDSNGNTNIKCQSGKNIKLESNSHNLILNENDGKVIMDDNEIAKNGHLTFENIYDKDGNNRFVEGNISLVSLSGLTMTYGKWSLSGSHFMFVVAGEIENGTTLPGGVFRFTTSNLPQYILDKISLTIGFGIEFKTIPFYAVDYSVQSLTISLTKSGNALQILPLSSLTANAKRYFRIQFDLLIDNE